MAGPHRGGGGALIEDPYLASGFRDVDANNEAGKFIRCLQFLDGLASFQDYKAQVLDRLRLGEGMRALDVGCGIGLDVARMAALVGPTGRVVGVDRSEAPLRVATDMSPGIAFALGIGEELLFASAEFDAARVDRTLQHVEDPSRVIARCIASSSPVGGSPAPSPIGGRSSSRAACGI
jgi:ubiquinone/menaquinone biosynthesis C-methylase UbiE